MRKKGKRVGVYKETESNFLIIYISVTYFLSLYLVIDFLSHVFLFKFHDFILYQLCLLGRKNAITIPNAVLNFYDYSTRSRDPSQCLSVCPSVCLSVTHTQGQKIKKTVGKKNMFGLTYLVRFQNVEIK